MKVIISLINIIFITVCFYSAQAKENKYKTIWDTPREHKYLFVDNLQLIGKFDTMTVFFTEMSLDGEIADAFYEFANRIGLDNGATIVNSRSYDQYAVALNALRCRPLGSEDIPAVVFSARASNRCFVFPTPDFGTFREVMLRLERQLKCPGNLPLDRGVALVKAHVRDLAERQVIARVLALPIFEFIDFIENEFRPRCPN